MSVNNSEHYIIDLALQLDENIHGANGELEPKQTHDRLMQSIVEKLNYRISHSGIDNPWTIAEHEHQPTLTLSQAAAVIIRVWLHKDRQRGEIMSLPNRLPSVAKLPDIINERVARRHQT